MALTRKHGLLITLAVSTVAVVWGASVAWHGGSPGLFWAGVTGLGFAAPRAWWVWRRQSGSQATSATEQCETPKPKPRPNPQPKTDLGELIEEMLEQGRYALLLRPQIVSNLDPQQLERTLGALTAGMSLTPEGEVLVAMFAGQSNHDDSEADETDPHHEQLMWVAGYCLDRHAVTNRQYQQFVESGGYEQMSFWEPEIRELMTDFVDATGFPGPRFWRDGEFPAGKEKHPVVGVNWYEAAAYAHWAGKRLPSDAEWVKAGVWPVTLAGKGRLQRRFPWGDSMERCRANLWGSNAEGTVSVDSHVEGTSVGGVLQLIGNVWEWTSDDCGALQVAAAEGRGATEEAALKSLRGGAFDTYFDAQATCQFQSGERPLSRKHNIGFRCALSICDLAAQPTVQVATSEPSLAEVVS